MKSAKSFIKFFDHYGYSISLFFTKKRDQVKTVIGGIASIFIGITLLAFTILKVIIMFNLTNVTIAS